MEQIGVWEMLVVASAGLLYFLPSYIGRRHQNMVAIFLLNLLLGWTILGWVGSLIWALFKGEDLEVE
ncbi:superinfection immunity protein [Flavobacterium sp. LAR06]|uniref:superinfection immunity protein n=1 Tax=Flavobacterium sp. LAR06 TaxID=3064897 RepID=UPI0035C20B56